MNDDTPDPPRRPDPVPPELLRPDPVRPDPVRPVPPVPPAPDEPWARRPVVRLRSPADVADLLPYLLGFHPTDSVVVLGLQGPRLQQGGTIRIDLPAEADWPHAAEDLARSLLDLSEQRRSRPRAVVVYLCQDGGRAAADRLRPLAGRIEGAFAAYGVAVHESLCVSDGRWWSYRCRGSRGCSCDPRGTPVQRPGTSPVAAAAAYAGIRIRGTLRELHAELAPIGSLQAEVQLGALERTSAPLGARLLSPKGPETVRQESALLIEDALDRFRAGARELPVQAAARLILGLQDRHTRDRAAEWMEAGDLVPAGRLWRYLSRRCVGRFRGHAAAPLSLLGWVSWVGGDEVAARVALAAALDANPEYTFATLLYQAVNSGADPERLRHSLRIERAGRAAPAAAPRDRIPRQRRRPEEPPKPADQP